MLAFVDSGNAQLPQETDFGKACFQSTVDCVIKQYQ